MVPGVVGTVRTFAGLAELSRTEQITKSVGPDRDRLRKSYGLSRLKITGMSACPRRVTMLIEVMASGSF